MVNRPSETADLLLDDEPEIEITMPKRVTRQMLSRLMEQEGVAGFYDDQLFTKRGHIRMHYENILRIRERRKIDEVKSAAYLQRVLPKEHSSAT